MVSSRGQSGLSVQVMADAFLGLRATPAQQHSISVVMIEWLADVTSSSHVVALVMREDAAISSVIPRERSISESTARHSTT